ncbi:MAG: SPOR domain-containing protein [Flavobacteriales bacterium]|nr:SPOR domain-containing protein [Flavobacteriales bacterium]
MRKFTLTLAVLLGFTLLSSAQAPAKASVGAGITYFMPDYSESAFGHWGAQEGGIDGLNLFANANWDLPFFDNYYLRFGMDGHYLAANGSNSSTIAAGFSPHFGLGHTQALDNGVLKVGLTMGVSLIRTWESTATGSNPLNASGYGFWGSMAVPAGVSVRYNFPSGDNDYYAGVDYRYFMFDDGIDGAGGGGNRIGRYDDHLMSFTMGINLPSSYRSKTLTALEKAKTQADAVPKLREQLEVSKQEKVALEDEVELAKSRTAEALQHADSLEAYIASGQPSSAANGALDGHGSTVTVIPTEGFLVVIGSFKSEALAKRYMNSPSLQGESIHMIKSGNGYHRVFAGPYDSQSKAIKVLTKARSATPGAWLLRTH